MILICRESKWSWRVDERVTFCYVAAKYLWLIATEASYWPYCSKQSWAPWTCRNAAHCVLFPLVPLYKHATWWKPCCPPALSSWPLHQTVCLNPVLWIVIGSKRAGRSWAKRIHPYTARVIRRELLSNHGGVQFQEDGVSASCRGLHRHHSDPDPGMCNT